MKYAVVIERGPTSYGAHVPDLAGLCGGCRDEGGGLYADAGGNRALPGVARNALKNPGGCGGAYAHG